MPSVYDYLDALDKQRDALAANLTTMGVTASDTEKFNTLVPKVLEISSGSTKIVLFDAENQDNISLEHNSTVYTLADFVALYPDFCSSDNSYALNYANTLLGWDVSIYTCCTVAVSLTSSSQIAVRFLSCSTESGVLRLVPATGSETAEEILTAAQTDGSYTDLSFQWLYSTDYITTLTPCTGITAGSYYVVWVGRSNNSQPKILEVAVI